MASNANVMYQAGWVVDGFYQSLAVAPPVLINLGSPGAPVHALPFRALGGSIADLDLLYGVLGKEGQEDIQPIFCLGSRANLLRCFGYEIPRQAIQDACIESYATLLGMEDIIIEANPAGSNLFGFVGLTTRPMSTVRLDNTDGYWSLLAATELLLNSPAGAFVDVAHSVVVPLLTGTVSAYRFEGSVAVLTYGFQARRKSAPSVSD